MDRQALTFEMFLNEFVEPEARLAYLRDIEVRVQAKQELLDAGEMVELEQDEALFLGIDAFNEGNSETFSDYHMEAFNDE